MSVKRILRRCLFMAVLVALVPAAGAQDVSDARALAEKHMCLGCHKVGGTLVGPSYREVAERYRNDPEAREKLVAKVKGGGRGAWGSTRMPAHTDVSEADIRRIIEWVLGL